LKSFNCGSFHDRSYDVASPIHRWLAQAALGVVAVLATGCATSSSVSRLRADVANLRVEMHHLSVVQQAAAGDLAHAVTESRSLATRTAEAAIAVEAAAAEVARLRTRIDALEAEVQVVKLRASTPIAPAPPTPAPVVPPVPAPPEAERAVTPPTAPSAPPTPPAPRVASTPPRPEHPRETPTKLATAGQTYGAALATFRARDHGQAVLEFLDFIATYPKHPLVANAQYWIGEAYYAQRDYRQAITEFAKVSVTAPGSAKAGDALFKIGLCQRRLRDEAQARQTWQRVVREFPLSEAAVKAREFLGDEAGTVPR
jgi:tol-pal system protein YbgF